jgi:hypothetical protein
VELAARFGAAQPSSLTVAAISAVFTIGYVANLLGEDEDWLFDLSIDMFPEDGSLGIRRRRGWGACLHQRRHRKPAPDYRR